MSKTIPSSQDLTRFISFLLVVKKASNKPQSIDAVKSRFLALCSYFNEKEWNEENRNEFIQERMGKYSASTLNKYISMGRLIDDYYKTDVWKNFSYFPEPHEVPQELLTIDEIERIANVELEYTKFRKFLNFRNKTLIKLLSVTGCRIDEALSMKRTDIFQGDHRVIFRDTKSNENRVVLITKSLFEMIKEIPNKSPYIFYSVRNFKKLSTQEVNLDLKRRAEKVGITKRVYCHLFRHSFITEMLNQKVDWMELSLIVGHKDPKTTRRYYHYSLEQQKRAMLKHPLRAKEISKEEWIDITKQIMQDRLSDCPFPFSLSVDKDCLKVHFR